jgi:hypothetical protein
MKTDSRESKWIPLALTLLVLPGMGHFHVKKKFKGYLFSGLALTIALGAFARYMSVLFALVNVHGASRPPKLVPWTLMAEAWRLDQAVLISFTIALILVWMGAALDLALLLKGKNDR